MPKKMFAFVLTFAFLITLLAGCGGSTTVQQDPGTTATEPAKSNEPAAAVQPTETKTISTKIGVGGKGAQMYLPLLLAEQNGYFKANGLDADVQDVKGGSQAAQALESGQVDFAVLGSDHIIKANVAGVPLVLLDVYTKYPMLALVVSSKLKDKVKTPADLAGLKIGITAPGSATHLALRALLKKNGVAENTVQVSGVGTSTAVTAIKEGKVDATMNVEPYISQLVMSGDAYMLWDLRSEKDTVALYGSDYPLVGLATRREVIEKNPEMVAKVVAAMYAANKFLATHTAEDVAAKVPADLKGDEAIYMTALKVSMKAFTPDGKVSDQALETVIKALKENNVVPTTADVSPSKLVDWKYIDKAAGK